MLRFDSGDLFATGSAPYAYRPATAQETSPRIILTVLIGDFQTSAFVDTGGVFLLCAPEIARYLRLDPRDGMPADRLWLRGDWLSGVLHRIPLTLVAQEGPSLTIDATAFVPELAPHQKWPDDFPCVLGMSGCLEFLRFAVDPADDTFYFGGLAEN